MTERTLDAIAAHYKRKYEFECSESLMLAAALEDVVEKNKKLVALAEHLTAEKEEE